MWSKTFQCFLIFYNITERGGEKNAHSNKYGKVDLHDQDIKISVLILSYS
jgi:hypothetical protein